MVGSGSLQITHDGRTLTFAPDETVSVGRDPGSSIVVDNPHVSWAHGELRQERQQWVYRDLRSTGGSAIEGQQVSAVTINRDLTIELAPGNGPSLALTLLGSAALPDTVDVSTTLRRSGDQRTVTIGRDLGNDIVLDDLNVSRNHAQITQSTSGLLLEDLGSRNGTFVNGRRISEAELVEGDLVAVGKSRYQVVGDHLLRVDGGGTISFDANAVSVEIGGNRLVDEVTFDLPERSLMAIVGPSGAGKSTLLSVLSGLRTPSGGSVLYEGRNLHADSDDLLSQIGFVPQADLLHDGLTVRESLRFTEQLRLSPDITLEERDRRIDDVLDQLGMGHRSEARIDQLSGGERKRVNVATELLTEPSLLLLDEPASGLDPGLERTLMRLLRKLADAGRTIIVVTHSLDSLDLCDRVLVLAPGGVPAYYGPKAGVADRFGHDDLVEAFRDLATQDVDWRDPRIRPNTEATTAATVPPPDRTRDGPRRRTREWLSQFGALSRRFIAVLASDRRNLALLLAQAPILGVLMLIAMPQDELSMPAPTEIRFVSTAGLVLFVVILGATWLGANNAIREIANERDLFLRERTAGLSISAYVTSKAVVLGVFTALQSFVLVGIATAAQGGPGDAVVLGWARGELMFVVAAAGIASMALALLVSAVVGAPDRATTLLPIVLILQFVLSAGGVLPEIVDKPVLREVSSLSSSQWGFAGAASTSDLNRLQAFTDQLRDLREVDAADPGPALAALEDAAEPPARWEHTPRAWFTALGALVALTVLPLVAAALVLLRAARQQ